MKQIISTILASIMAVLAFESIIVTVDELALRGSRDASTRSLSSSSFDVVFENAPKERKIQIVTASRLRAVLDLRTATTNKLTIKQ